MKSIKTNPNCGKGPDKGKIWKQIALHIIDNTWVALILFFLEKKPDMKFIILVSNLKETSHNVFSWKTIYKQEHRPRVLDARLFLISY
jgi:hypothetical protein